MVNAGTMPMQNNSNAGVLPYSENTSAMPQNVTNTDTMPQAVNQPNTAAMPYAGNTMNNPMNNVKAEAEQPGCGYKMGELPPCAPLAVGYIPFQQENPPQYAPTEALTRGTLFPGLDLPYLNVVNKGHPYAGTPLGELMALSFVVRELNLYLDTHPNDSDALDMLQTTNKLFREGVERYSQRYGPISINDLTSGNQYTWINNPWPWDYNEMAVKTDV